MDQTEQTTPQTTEPAVEETAVAVAVPATTEPAEKKTVWQTIKLEGERLAEEIEQFIHEGNVRRIVVKQGDKTVAEFPLAVGVVGTVLAAPLAALGALAALLNDCTIEIERDEPPAEQPAPVPMAEDTSLAATMEVPTSDVPPTTSTVTEQPATAPAAAA